MNRREVLAGAVSVSALGVAGYSVFGRQGRTAGERIDPVTIDTLDVAGSPGTAVSVPFGDAVTVIDLFATTCTACPAHIDTLERARDRLDDRFRFASVTNQVVDDRQPRSYFRDWWRQHGGEWPVGFDEGGALTEAFDVPVLPFTGIVAPDGSVRWTTSGQPSVDAVVKHARSSLQTQE